MFHIPLSNGYRELTSNPSTHKDGKNFMILRKPQIFFKEKYDFLKIDLCDRVGDGLAAHLDALADFPAVERAGEHTVGKSVNNILLQADHSFVF